MNVGVISVVIFNVIVGIGVVLEICGFFEIWYVCGVDKG